jgi:serine/threonine protein kinase
MGIEMLRSDLNTMYKKNVDIFSFGIIAYEMICEQRAFTSRPSIKLTELIVDGSHLVILPSVVPFAKSLIERNWNSNSALRPSFLQIHLEFLCQRFGLFPGVDFDSVLACHQSLLSFRPSQEIRLTFLQMRCTQYDRFDLSPDLSLSEVGQIASEKWNLVDIKPEFMIVEEGSDCLMVALKTELIGDLSLGGKELAMRIPEDQIVIQFQVRERGNCTFVVGFSEIDIVSVAKAKVGNHLQVKKRR